MSRQESYHKVRRIKMAYHSNSGMIPTEKNLTDGFVEFESTIEFRFYHLLMHDPHCLDFESQPLEIPHPTHPNSPYVPDIWAKFDTGVQFLFDVKPKEFFESLKRNPEEAQAWEIRSKTIESYCKKTNLQYLILMDEDLNNPRHSNVEKYDYFSRKSPNFDELLPTIVKYLKENPKTILESIEDLSKHLKIESSRLIPILNYMIYYDYFLIDFESDIINETTILIPKLDKQTVVLPLYQYLIQYQKNQSQEKENLENSQSKKNTIDNLNTKPNQQDFLALPENIQQEVNRRLKLLEIFNQPDFTTKKLIEFANSNDINFSTLYNWKSAYDNEGWQGLIPNYQKRGRKKGQDPKLEDLIQKAINDCYKNHNEPSISGCYRILQSLCLTNGITPCAKETFRKRIEDHPDKDLIFHRKGKKVYKETFTLLQGDEFPYGKYPLDTIEIDHTDLDIILVDRIERKPISGKPHITLAIDVYSRMIFGLYLSFDHASYLSIGMCLLMGISPKDVLVKKYKTQNLWPIQGIPRKFLVDNGKDFKGKGLDSFCKQFEIDLIFNPPRTPQMKGHVERVFGRIKAAIRDDLIGGYTPPIEQRQKNNYNPEKTAVLTLEEFETWLIHWIVDDYHIRDHQGLEEKEGEQISPLEMYQQGLEDTENFLVGQPILPSSLEDLHFDVLNWEKHGISRNGIKMFGMQYSAPILNKLLGLPKSSKKDYIIRYDPRNILEIYLYCEDQKQYMKIPMKNTFLKQLKMKLEDFPLSLQELKAIKKNRNKKSPLKEEELAKAINKRQELIESSKKAKKTTNSDRKRQAVLKHHKKHATSQATLILNSEKKSNPDNQNNSKDSQDPLDKSQIEKKVKKQYQPTLLPSSIFPNKKNNTKKE